MKKTLLAAMLAFAGLAAQAADYFVVVPVAGRTSNIGVTLNSYTLPSAEASVPYNFDFKNLLSVTGDAAYDGTGVSWSLAGGALPSGMTLNASTGVLSGTPAAEGTYSFSVKAAYKVKNGQQSYQLITVPHLVVSLSGTLPTGKLGTAYTADLKSLVSVTGDSSYTSADVTWKLASGSLPAGLTLNANGTITGTPTADGSFPVTVEASYKSRTAQKAYTLAISDVDPYYANVVLLMHFDGDLTDSAKGKTTTNTGTSNNTSIVKFGSGSRYFPGTTANNLLVAAAGDFNFGTSNFTIEGWFYKLDAPTATNNDRAMFSGQWGSYTTGSYWLGGYANNANSSLRGTVIGAFYGQSGVLNEPNTALGQWVHYAWVREGTALRMYRGGQLVGSTTIALTQPLGNNSGLFLGRVADNTSYPGFYGYMDEIRVTKGVARYSAPFTPKEAPFPNQ